MPDKKLSTDLPHDIHLAELDTIQDRRRSAGLDADTPVLIPGGEPAVDRGLIGLAISGGGIRSSTFSLGVLQSLANAGVFKRFDLMSTVSGGGYTGSMLSSLLKNEGDAGPDGDDFPLAKPDGDTEPAALQHLRNGSNYLNPGGPLDGLRLPAVVIRGLLMNLMLVLPHLMVLALLTELADELRIVPMLAPFLSGKALLIVGTASVIAYFGIAGAEDLNWNWRDRLEHSFAWIVLLAALAFLIPPVLWAVDLALDYPLRGADGLTGFIQSHMTSGTLLITAGVVAAALTVGQASKQLSNYMSKLMLVLATVAGPLIMFAMYLFLVVAQVDSPYLPGSYPELSTVSAAGDTAVTGETVASRNLRKALALKGLDYPMTGVASRSPYDSVAAIANVSCGGRIHLLKPPPLSPSSFPENTPADLCGLPDGDIEQESQYVRLVMIDEEWDDWEIIGAKLRWGGEPSAQALVGDWTFLALIVLLYAFNFLMLDVNKSSLHGFYRDRLSKLYLFVRGPDDTIESNDAQKLTDLSRPGSVAPYHIINTTVNLQGVSTLGVRGRGSDFFFFSKHYCGGPNTGYIDTKSMEKWDRHMNLGTALAISAAAAAPNMGRTTVRHMVFMLTLLNLRLGYWVPNPRSEFWPLRIWPTPIRVPRGTPKARSPQLWKEATSALDAHGPLVNLSDGGHLENLAIYELLRRKCATIVAIDGEADPNLTFEGLVTLMRIAKIDLGVDIEINLDRIHWNEHNLTKAHFAIGSIDYGEGETGTLVYVKSSVTGDEGPVLKKYRADHETFPHETTADQFFDELQFEAYRSLGEHVGELVARGAKSEGVWGFENVPEATEQG